MRRQGEHVGRAEQGGDFPLIRDIQALSLRYGEGDAAALLQACARVPDAMEALGSREGIGAKLRMVFDLPLGDTEAVIAAACCDDRFDVGTLERIAAANAAWGTSTGLNCADLIAAWRLHGPAERAASRVANIDRGSVAFGRRSSSITPTFM